MRRLYKVGINSDGAGSIDIFEYHPYFGQCEIFSRLQYIYF